MKSITLFYHHKKGYENIRKKIEEELETVKTIGMKEVLFEKKEKDIDKIEKKHKSLLRNLFKKKTKEKKLEKEIDEIDKIM